LSAIKKGPIGAHFMAVEAVPVGILSRTKP
jgi:hypothetical protein